MGKFNLDILADIDATLNELIEIAEVLKAAKMDHYFTHEVAALEKTQESLLARLMHREATQKMDKQKKTLDSLRKEAVERKVIEYAQVIKTRRQKRAKSASNQ